MNKVNISNIIIVILSITIVSLGIGFIVVSMKYHSLKNSDNSFNIEFTRVKKQSSVKGGKEEPIGHLDIVKDNKEIKMDFNLNNENDALSYEIEVKNTGTLTAEITDLVMSPDFVNDNKDLASPVAVTLSDISGKILEPGETTTAKLTIMYPPSPIKGTKNIKGKLGIIAANQK